MLVKYGEVDASFPERILIMAEMDQRWRMEMSATLVSAEVFTVRLGALTLPIVSVLMLGVAAFAIWAGEPNWWLVVGAIPTIITAVAHLVAQVRNPQPSPEPRVGIENYEADEG